MMELILRDYQRDVIKQTYKHYANGIKSVLLYSPTGSGKTIVGTKMIADAISKGRRVLFLVHRTKLIPQTADTLLKFYGIESGIIWGDVPTDYSKPVQLAMIQTLQNRPLPPDIGLVILDECHTTSYYSIFSKVMNHYSGGILLDSPCYFLGLSASPWRSKRKEGYCQYFQAVVKAPCPQELIKKGKLCYARFFGWGGLIDYDQLEVGNGDYTLKSIQKVCNSDFNATVVEKFLEHCPERKAIAFCAGVVQAENLANQFTQAGIVAEVVTGNVDEDTRETIYNRFKTGETQIISSVSCLCEGFDETSCNAAILARPTRSRALLVQMCGRALRLHSGKEDTLLLDFADNFERLGLPTQDYKISLCPANTEEVDMSKTCPACGATVFKFVQVCPECGFEFEGGGEDDQEESAEPIFGELLNLDQKKQVGYLRGQLKKAYKSGKDYGRVTWLFHRKFNVLPPQDWYRDAIFRRGKNPHPKQRKADEQRFIRYLNQIRPGAPNGWIAEMMRREFGYGYYDLDPINWWEILNVPLIPDWREIKSAYQKHIAIANKSEAALLNFCLEEGREFCRVNNIKLA